ncbi:MAG: hypothetical protein ACI4VQ_00250 [Clostridia bacterium]
MGNDVKQGVNGKNPQDKKLDLSNNEAQNKRKQEAINVIKPIFERYNAIDKDNTMTKEEVLAEIEKPEEKKYFNYLKSLNIIKKEKGKYYYNSDNEKNAKEKNLTSRIFAIAITAIVVIAIISLILGQSTTNIETISNKDVKFEIETDWNTWSEYDEEYGWSYFKYISGAPISANNEILNEIDYSIYPAIICVSYDKENTGEYNSINDLKTLLEAYIEGSLLPEEYNMSIVVTEKGYSALRTRIKYTSEPEEVDYYYYIYNNGKMAYISGITYNVDDEEELESVIIDIVNSFEWKE